MGDGNRGADTRVLPRVGPKQLGGWKPVLWARREQMQNCSKNGQNRKPAEGSLNCPLGRTPLDSNDWSFLTLNLGTHHTVNNVFE